jgi:hypothetical protein
MVGLMLASMSFCVVGVQARGGPKPTSEFVLRVPNMDGDAKRIHGGFILVRAKEGPTSSGGGGRSIVFPCT